jgi:hypothetical protein
MAPRSPALLLRAAVLAVALTTALAQQSPIGVQAV